MMGLLLAVTCVLGWRAHSEGLGQAPITGAEARVRAEEGEDGIAVLTLFGGDAEELFATSRAAFRELMAVVRLEPPAREISAGPWREAVVEWARAGRLQPFLEHLKRLVPVQWPLANRVPACLPLLGRGAREAEAMLTLHGERAWRLLRVVDCADDVEGVERVARALAIHGDQMLRENESCGPALAMHFIPQVRDDKEILHDLYVEAMRALDVTDAQALFVANYDDLARLVLEEGQQPAAIVNTFRLLGGQPEANPPPNGCG